MKKLNELLSLDVSEFVEVTPTGLSYLPWAMAWREFIKIYPDAEYDVVKSESGLPYFGEPKIGYMVYTRITAGGVTHEMWLPVMDHSNKTMKLEPYTYTTKRGEKSVEGVDMFAVNKAIMRCLVKNMAMFGMGLYIYAGEDLPEMPKVNASQLEKLKKLPQEYQEKLLSFFKVSKLEDLEYNKFEYIMQIVEKSKSKNEK